MTRIVYLASPYSGDVEANVAYAQDAMRHSLSMGETAPTFGRFRIERFQKL